jgi:hypothetical protein
MLVLQTNNVKGYIQASFQRLDRLAHGQGEDAQLVGVGGSRSRSITLHYDRVGRLVERETHTAS